MIIEIQEGWSNNKVVEEASISDRPGEVGVIEVSETGQLSYFEQPSIEEWRRNHKNCTRLKQFD